MKLPVADAVVVITGASSGIGRAAAEAFARRGAHVVIAARRARLLEEVAAGCRRHGVDALVVPTDVADSAAVEHLRAAALDRFGRIDIWVNNAAVLVFGNLEETPLDAYRRVIDINLFGCLHGSRAALSVFRGQGSGRLINVGSLFGRMSTAGVSAYIVSKHAVQGLTRALRQETALDPDIHVGAIVPAGVDTPILDHAANYMGVRVRALYPLTTAEDAADAIVRMAHRPRREMFVGRVGQTHDTLQRWAPEIHDRAAARLTRSSRDRADRMPVTDGNLYEPVEDGRGISGGIRRPRIAARRAGLVALAAALVAREVLRRD